MTTLVVTSAILYPLITVTAYYLGAWALVTSWLWSRYPPRVDQWARCAACSGFSYGIAVALVGGLAFDLPFLGLPGDAWYTPLAVGLCSVAWTPPLAWLHLSALVAIGNLDAGAERAGQDLEDRAP